MLRTRMAGWACYGAVEHERLKVVAEGKTGA